MITGCSARCTPGMSHRRNGLLSGEPEPERGGDPLRISGHRPRCKNRLPEHRRAIRNAAPGSTRRIKEAAE